MGISKTLRMGHELIMLVVNRKKNKRKLDELSDPANVKLSIPAGYKGDIDGLINRLVLDYSSKLVNIVDEYHARIMPSWDPTRRRRLFVEDAVDFYSQRCREFLEVRIEDLLENAEYGFFDKPDKFH